jgi:hypothetical protein
MARHGFSSLARSSLVAFAAALLALPAAAQRVLTFGDSITVGADDERFPDDSCSTSPPTFASSMSGWRGALECRLGRGGANGFWWSHFAHGGTTSRWAALHVQEAIATLPDGDVALVSFHVNDCARACGSVCVGGDRDGLACLAASDCPGEGAACDTSAQRTCTPAEIRENLRVVVDSLLEAGYGRVVFWKSPGLIGSLEAGASCALSQFDGSPDAIDTLFLRDLRPEGYADEPRVEYLDATFRDFCVGTGLPGCGPDDGLGDRRAWWFGDDGESVRRGRGAVHLHPNAWGYMELAARLGEALTGAPVNAPPGRPSVVVTNRDETSVSLLALRPADPDGDAVTLYAWAACADVDGTSGDPACDRRNRALDTGPFLPRECGAIDGSDHDGIGSGDLANPGYRERHLVEFGGGGVTLRGLFPGTDYRLCVVAHDGFQGSLPNDMNVVTTRDVDSDGDGWLDGVDDCRDVANASQLDSDRDGFGNACDGDFDGDGFVGSDDLQRQERAFGKRRGEAGYDEATDLNADGVVGLPDRNALVRMLGGPPGPSGLACAGAPACGS